MNIAWMQVILAFLLGVLLSASFKGLLSSAKSKVGG